MSSTATSCQRHGGLVMMGWPFATDIKDPMSEDQIYQGGCLCGAVRYRVTGRPIWTAFCHCRSCRHATGSAVAAYAGYAADRFEITAGEPSHFASSEGVRRGFCRQCGAPLTFEGARWPGEIHLHIGSLDEPQAFPPTGHSFEQERISWLHVSSTGEPAETEG